jgi:predicted Zn-dependent peptidase
LVSHYKKTHTLPNARFIVAGHFSAKYDEVIALIEQRIKLPKKGKRIPMPKELPNKLDNPLVFRKPSVPNNYLFIDFYADRLFNQKELAALQLVSTIMTDTMYSRIFGAAREKGWVYHMFSGAASVGASTGWWMGAQVSKTNSQPLLRLIRDECLRLKSGVLDDADFQAAKKHLLGNTMRAGQTASNIVSRYGKYYIEDEIEDMNKIPALIERVSPEDCIKVFQKLCSDSRWGLGVLGSTSLVPARKLHDYANEIFEQN